MFDRDHLHELRQEELRVALTRIDISGKDILEIGAADGYVASVLSRSANVTAIDIAEVPDALFPVAVYDGRRLPFADAQFDIVFSSHVLEHIRHLHEFHDEMRRVLRSGGLAIHVVPSASWRFWTMLAHYPALPKVVRWKLCSPGTSSNQGSRNSKLELLAKVLVAPRHGESGTALMEFLHMRRMAWIRKMREGGWSAVNIKRTGIFYTGYEMFGAALSIGSRRRLASVFGSASTIIFAAKNDG